MVNISLRQLIIRRDEGICRLCKDRIDESDLEIHHIKHEQSDYDEIITTDSTCHEQFHKIETALKKGKNSIYSCGHCKDKPQLLQHQLSNRSEIRICPNCLYGDQRTADGSIEAIWRGVESLHILKEYLISEGINLEPRHLIQERQPFIPDYHNEMELIADVFFSKKYMVLVDFFEGPFYEMKDKKGKLFTNFNRVKK